jgi:hypothetical protein
MACLCPRRCLASAVAALVPRCGCVGLLILGACSSSGSEEASRQAKTVVSYARSASMILDAWREGRAPYGYTKRSLESTLKTVDALPDELKQSLPAGDPALAILESHIGGMRAALASGSAGLAARNEGSVELASQRLRMTANELDSWVKRDAGSAQ